MAQHLSLFLRKRLRRLDESQAVFRFLKGQIENYGRDLLPEEIQELIKVLNDLLSKREEEQRRIIENLPRERVRFKLKIKAKTSIVDLVMLRQLKYDREIDRVTYEPHLKRIYPAENRQGRGEPKFMFIEYDIDEPVGSFFVLSYPKEEPQKGQTRIAYGFIYFMLTPSGLIQLGAPAAGNIKQSLEAIEKYLKREINKNQLEQYFKKLNSEELEFLREVVGIEVNVL
jgi:hypothetical protein